MSERPVAEAGHYKGWLWKWTNYIKGYQRRWFVLSDGLLSYYRSQAEMAHTCRGTINLAGAFIVTEESCNFTVSNGGTQTFHLKANHEVERQRWITALELAKAKLVSWGNDGQSSDDEESIDGNLKNSQAPLSEESDVITSLKALTTKLEDLQTCHDLITKHGNALQKAVTELEVAGGSFTEQSNEAVPVLSKKVTERAALFRITSTAMISTSSDFLQLAQEQSKRWRKAILHERNQRLRMEETVESLAKQHNHLERAIRSGNRMNYDMNNFEDSPNHSSDESDTEEWTDALDEYAVAEEKVKPTNDVSLTTSSGSFGAVGATAESKAQKIVSLKETIKVYRTSIPEKPHYSLSLWSIMKNCIGRDLSKIPMPVNFNEPLSMLQRLGEDMEYCDLLHQAAKMTNQFEQMAYVVAFSMSGYASTIYRIGKPFNPLLGETFDLDRLDDLGIRMLCEQVGHHPPCAAFNTESKDCSKNTGWTYWTDITVSSKFRGKYLSVTPLGTMHLKFHATGNHYTWKKVTTTVNNIIVGKLWVDQSGECEVRNHKTGDVCKHKYHAYSYFSREVGRRVTGTIEDKHGKEHYQIFGTWDKFMEYSKVELVESSKGKNASKTPAKAVWNVNPLPPNADKIYFFSKLATSLNQPDADVAPTDSRNRPDQRLMEIGKWDQANETKSQLEQAQRVRRAARKSAHANAAAADPSKKQVSHELWNPCWFEQTKCEVTGEACYRFTDEYWSCKEKKDWSRCTSIFDLDPKSGGGELKSSKSTTSAAGTTSAKELKAERKAAKASS